MYRIFQCIGQYFPEYFGNPYVPTLSYHIDLWRCLMVDGEILFNKQSLKNFTNNQLVPIKHILQVPVCHENPEIMKNEYGPINFLIYFLCLSPKTSLFCSKPGFCEKFFPSDHHKTPFSTILWTHYP